jgi:hypothetical protein
MAKSRGTGLKDKSEDSETYHLAHPSKYRPSAARCGNNIYIYKYKSERRSVPVRCATLYSYSKNLVNCERYYIRIIYIYMSVFLRKKHPMYILLYLVYAYTAAEMSFEESNRILKKLELFFFSSQEFYY